MRPIENIPGASRPPTPGARRTWATGLILTGACCLLLGGCGVDLIGAKCGPNRACPNGMTCSQTGYCTKPHDAGVPEFSIPDFGIPDVACPSGLLCGKPAKCCKSGEECVEGQCLPACPSGVRCLTPTVRCCNSGEVCLSGACTKPGQGCKDSFDCPSGYFCEPTLGKCLPQPKNKCEVKPTKVTFKPVVEWNWTGYSKDTKYHEVSVTPSVADLDGDGTPEVVFTAYNHDNADRVMLVVLDGATGKEEWVIPWSTYPFVKWSGVALGNLDSDSQLEIVALLENKGVAVFEHDGKLKWSSAAGSLAKVADPKLHYYPYPLLADLDADGTPEIVVGGVALSATGTLLFDNGMIGSNGSWILPAAADLDEDGKLELVGGNVVYDHKGKQVWKNSAAPDGLVAVADLDRDGWADVVTVSAGYVRVLRGSAKSGKTAGEVIFGAVAIPGGGAGGAPTVGDFDGDGRPEFSAAGKGKYTVYDLDCKTGGSKTFCASERTDGILWDRTTKDISSSVTGSSLYDFEGDGRVEVVYNDECHLYVYDGQTGNQLMQVANTTRTTIEYPLIVDVDGDNNSEFVVPSNDDQIARDKCTPPGTKGLRVFGDSADLWVPTRRVWNQHTYHITNITGAGLVPTKEDRNWDRTDLNNFRQNVQGAGIFNAPDLRIGGIEAYLGGCPYKLELRARVVNVGSLGVKAGVKVAFYEGAVGATSKLVGTATTQKPLLPGNSELVKVSYSVPKGQEGPFSFWANVDDDGTGQGGVSECDEKNNGSSITGVKCYTVK
jgi:hypothetical protein